MSKAKLKPLSTWLWTTTTTTSRGTAQAAGQKWNALLAIAEELPGLLGSCPLSLPGLENSMCQLGRPVAERGESRRRCRWGAGKEDCSSENWVTSNRKMYFIVCIRTFRFATPHTHTPSLSCCPSLSISLSVCLYIPSHYYPFICLSSGSALNLSSNWWYCTFLELNQLCRSPTSNELPWAGFSSPGILIFNWELNKILFNYSKNNRNKFMYDMSKFWSITPIYNIIYNW